MAIVHAGSQTPADTVAASCWSDLRYVIPASIPPDAKMAYAVQRLRVLEANQKHINADCPKVLPKFVKLFNDALKAAKEAGP